MQPSRRDFLRSCVGIGISSIGIRVRAGELETFLSPAPVTRTPYLQSISSDSATILFRSVVNGLVTVHYSSDGNYSSTITALTRELTTSETGLAVPMYQYEAVLPGLTAGTRYSYQLALDGQPLTFGGTLSFKTAGAGHFSFLAFGDSGIDSSAQYLLARRMAVENPDLVLHTGDVAYLSGRFDEFEQRHFAYYQDLMTRVPFFPCPGNHDYLTDNARPYLLMHSLPEASVPEAERGRYYSFDWGNAHFVSLDSNASLASAARGNGGMLNWLEADLAKTQKFWRIVYFHHPPYSNGIHSDDPIEALVRDQIVPILERNNVDLVLNGHEHSYQRTYPIKNGRPVGPNQGPVYITTGGGGSDLYPVFLDSHIAAAYSVYHFLRAAVQGFRMDVSAIQSDGTTIETISFAPPPVISGAQVFNSRQGVLLRIAGLRLAADEILISEVSRTQYDPETTVTIGSAPQSLLYISPTEIICRIGRERVSPQVPLAVTTPNGQAEFSLARSIDLRRRLAKLPV